MTQRKSKIVILGIILLSFITAFYFYPQMPEEMASHWNLRSEVNGYLPKFWGLFLMPLILIGIFLLYLLIPKIDPLKQNIEKFRKYFDGFITLIVLFLFYLYLLTIFWNLGMKFDMIKALIPALGILFYCSGVVLEQAKRNWFIGIRTPWTLSSNEVWNKTHQLGGRLFKMAGLLVLLGIFFKEYIFWFVLVPIIMVVIYTTLYSYFEYQKVEKSKTQ
jgi:uncharacterized membrane protein